MTGSKQDCVSGYSHIDRTAEPLQYVRKLDERAKSNLWQSIKSRMLDLLEVRQGMSVIDVGCGTGNDVRDLAYVVGTSGRVVGVDASRAMIRVAMERSAGNGLPVQFCTGDAHSLPFPSLSFDCSRAERVLQHLSDPEQAVREIVRVTRDGGRIVVVEPDYGAVIIRGGNAAVTNKLIALRSAHYRSGRIGMLLPMIFKRLGLVDIDILRTEAVVSIINDEAEQLLLTNYVNPAISYGTMSNEEGLKWIFELKQAANDGQFHYSTPLFLVAGRKPFEILE